MLYFSEYNFRGNHAGTKARNDVEKLLHDMGAKPINSKRLELTTDSDEVRIYANIRNRFGYKRYFRDIRRIKGEVVVIQYPMLSFDIDYEYISELSKENKILFLVHDIHSLRLHDKNHIKKELEILNKGYGIFVHSEEMKARLIDEGLRVKNIFILQYFDYLYDGESGQYNDGIIFAGNLGKSVFLKEAIKANPEICFRLYGNGWNGAEFTGNGNVDYRGSFTPDEVPGKLCGQFGLVWDGDTTDGCAGRLGEYTKINSPHKLSLYLAAGIPVIVWKEAAVAPFVLEQKLGICCDSISGLKQVLDKVTEEEYRCYQESIAVIREDLVTGRHFKTIILSAVRQCEDELI